MSELFLGSMGCLIEEPPSEAAELPVRATRMNPKGTLRIPTPTRDQLDLGSCVAQTLKKQIEIIDGTGIQLSALGIYFDIREFSGFRPDQDSGAYPEAAVRAMVARGVGSVTMWPYDTSRLAEEPPAEYYAQAADHRVFQWHRARTVAQAKTALSMGLPIGMAFDVPSSFAEVGRTGLWVDRGGSPEGGHETCVVGWDDAKIVPGYPAGAFQVLNWWSIKTGWGVPLEAYPNYGACSFWIPYAAYEPGNRVSDAIVISIYDGYPGGPPPFGARARALEPEVEKPKPKAKAKRRTRKKTDG